MKTATNKSSVLTNSALTNRQRWQHDPLMQRLRPKGLPLLFGDEDFEMGESSLHTTTCDIVLYGLEFHFASRPGYRVFGNLNLHYSEDDPNAYASPDFMVVKPRRPLPEELSSYRIGQEGPAPVLVGEVLSFRTYQQGDLTNKPILYSDLGIGEYILVDVTGALLPERLLLLRRKPDGSWADEQDADGGVTSRLGCRLVLEADGQVRVIDAATGKRYARPREAQEATDRLAAETEARRQAQERAQALEAQLNQLRGASAASAKPARKGTKRRPKP
jgi:Uma2 family endonuclease